MRKVPIIILILFWFLSITNFLNCQNLVFSGEFGKFRGAKSFSITTSGFIYVTDTTSNELIKLDTLGNVIKFISGYGWQVSAFDEPVDVYATPLNVYVSDKNNNRIQYFDKDLNFLSQFSTQNSTDSRYIFNYPTCSAVSNQGDFFILDSDNRRILKFNIRGEFQTTIGGFDAGEFALANPASFAITNSSKLLVVDPPSIVEFDQFGNGIRKFSLPFEPNNINSLLQKITINNNDEVAILSNTDLENGIVEPLTLKPGLNKRIMDTCVVGSRLFVLTTEAISIFRIILPK